MTGRRTTTAVAVLLLLTLTAPAVAGVVVVTDRDDTRSPLDLRRLRMTHTADRDVFRIAMHDAFRDGRIDGERGWLRIGFRTDDDRFVRSVYVYLVEGELRGVVSDAGGRFVRFVPARRVAPDRIVVRVPASAIGVRRYRVAVWSVWNGWPCRGEACVDWLPDSGTIRPPR